MSIFQSLQTVKQKAKAATQKATQFLKTHTGNLLTSTAAYSLSSMLGFGTPAIITSMILCPVVYMIGTEVLEGQKKKKEEEKKKAKQIEKEEEQFNFKRFERLRPHMTSIMKKISEILAEERNTPKEEELKKDKESKKTGKENKESKNSLTKGAKTFNRQTTLAQQMKDSWTLAQQRRDAWDKQADFDRAKVQRKTVRKNKPVVVPESLLAPTVNPLEEIIHSWEKMEAIMDKKESQSVPNAVAINPKMSDVTQNGSFSKEKNLLILKGFMVGFSKWSANVAGVESTVASISQTEIDLFAWPGWFPWALVGLAAGIHAAREAANNFEQEAAEQREHDQDTKDKQWIRGMLEWCDGLLAPLDDPSLAREPRKEEEAPDLKRNESSLDERKSRETAEPVKTKAPQLSATDARLSAQLLNASSTFYSPLRQVTVVKGNQVAPLNLGK